MKRAWVLSAIFLSISTAWSANKDNGSFKPGPASSYSTKQTQDKVTIAAIPYVNDDELKNAFGKDNPYRYGILPVLVVVQNDSGKTLRLNLRAEFVDERGRHVEAIPADDVPYIVSPPRRNDSGGPIPLPTGPIGRRNKKVLKGWEIEGRAFAARMMPAGDSAHGFFYFQAKPEPGSMLYVTGIQDASSGREWIYFEIPLDASDK